jgi:hypothetical protein
MFALPVDAWYLWIGLSIVGMLTLAAVLHLPTTTPPDAQEVAQTIESVAVSTYDATAEQPTTAEEVRLGPWRIDLRTEDHTSHATLAHGPVVPVAGHPALKQVATGAPPEHEFASPAHFEEAARRARSGNRNWTETDGTLVVRHVTWGESDVTLVGA